MLLCCRWVPGLTPHATIQRNEFHRRIPRKQIPQPKLTSYRIFSLGSCQFSFLISVPRICCRVRATSCPISTDLSTHSRGLSRIIVSNLATSYIKRYRLAFSVCLFLLMTAPDVSECFFSDKWVAPILSSVFVLVQAPRRCCNNVRWQLSSDSPRPPASLAVSFDSLPVTHPLPSFFIVPFTSLFHLCFSLSLLLRLFLFFFLSFCSRSLVFERILLFLVRFYFRSLLYPF